MKAKRLEIHNIGMIAHEVIDFNKPLLLFYGEIMQGKTTILNAVKLCFGGGFPTDIIRHGESEAYVQLTFDSAVDSAVIRREFYVNATGEVTARPISFTRDGQMVRKPVEAIKEFLNPFLLDQNHLFNMTELERKKFFVDLFGVDTSDLDEEYKSLEGDCKTLRIEIKSFGDIDLTPVEEVDVSEAKRQLHEIELAHRKAEGEYQTQNQAATERNIMRARAESRIQDIDKQIAELMAEKERGEKWLQENPVIVSPAPPERPDTTELQETINNAAVNRVKREQYENNLSRQKAKEDKERQLREKEARQREIKVRKGVLLRSISQSTGIDGLEFDEEGNFVYEGTQAGMLSTSQLMRLSAELSAKYPEGFGLELIDRGESLGKSIFEFVKRAERDERTILATIVGDKPADVPDNIGVFVVEDGRVKK